MQTLVVLEHLRRHSEALFRSILDLRDAHPPEAWQVGRGDVWPPEAHCCQLAVWRTLVGNRPQYVIRTHSALHHSTTLV